MTTMPLYRTANGLLVAGGELAASQSCCCGGCPRCIINGQIDCNYTTEAECEECVTTTYCYDYYTGETFPMPLGGCPSGSEAAFEVVEGPCGTWTPNQPCGPCPCDSDSDCPNFQQPCEQIFPESPYTCCDGGCTEWACYPGARIILNFRKKAGCAFLPDVAEGEEFAVTISGGFLYGCIESSVLSGAPCLTQWTLSRGCVVTNLTFDASVNQACQDCYEFLGWQSCRLNCAGVCV